MTDFLSHLLGNHFLLKLVLTPLIISAATLVSRRWGETVGGLMIGLPLTSAPVSFFFAIEQGSQFAGKAALSAMIGLLPVTAFCASYVIAARHLRWQLAALISVGAYTLMVIAVSFLGLGVWQVILLVPLALAGSLWIMGKPATDSKHIASPWWDIPLRMVIATTILLLITTGAGYLGPKWSGLLSPFPIFTFVMAFFSHRQGGSEAAGRFIRGVIRGLFGYLAFFLVISQFITLADLAVVYGLAATAALSVNGISLWAQTHPVRAMAGAK